MSRHPLGGALRASEEPQRGAFLAGVERLCPDPFSVQIENAGSIPKVRPVTGDSLRISLSFVDRSTGQPQRLRISDLGLGEAVEHTFARADGDPFLSVKAFTLNSFTFHNVMGEILSYPMSVPVITGGAGIGANTFPNLTDTSF